MQSKKMMAWSTTGLLMSFGATAENYRWDNVAMGGGGRWTAIAEPVSTPVVTGDVCK